MTKAPKKPAPKPSPSKGGARPITSDRVPTGRVGNYKDRSIGADQIKKR